MRRPQNRYLVTGNIKPMRLGRIFPTGWTRLERADGACEIAASTSWPNDLRGSAVAHIGTVEVPEIFKRQTHPARGAKDW